MKKAALLLIVLMILPLSALISGDIDFQFGGGYNGYFTGSSSNDPNFPAGFSLFGGAGYKILPTLSGGVEYEFAKSWSNDDDLNGLSVSLNEHVPKLYVKMNALNLLTVTALGGMDFQKLLIDNSGEDNRYNPTIGLRVSALYAYAQYMMVFDDTMAHRLSAGVILNK